MDLKGNLGTIITEYRKSKSLTTQALAKKLNLSVGTINNIENGKSDFFKLEILFKLLYILDIPASVIVDNILSPEEFIFSTYKKKSEDYGFPKFDLFESPETIYELTKILYTISEFIAKFTDSQAALEIVSKHIFQNLETLNKFASLEKKE
jgi:transcriptional regulator with XRE-family HTH domain